ncbi:hypothetical protein [Paenibacillus sp. FSL R5-192]|uniref:hypothetical protein n=1 Tax=Paenibacillus sp. FSL R5-192 TaxID=1226754 RepID=UPI0004BB035F
MFEYFNNYLTESASDEKTYLQSEKLEKYRGQLAQLDSETAEWLVQMFDNHGKMLNHAINNFLKKQELFLIYNSDAEFRSVSYECYTFLSKKHPYLRDHTEMLFIYIKEHHGIKSQERNGVKVPYINEEINNWLEETSRKHQVNLWKFTYDWVIKFYEEEKLWPATHRKKSNDSWRNYEYDYKQKSNLFNLNELYRRLPKKSFIRGKKQELEILMMYNWLFDVVGDEEYWDEYISKVIENS